MNCSLLYFRKKTLAVLIFLGTFFPQLRAQVPSFIPYQAVARDASGLAKTNTPIQVEFRIFNSMPDGNPAYREVHSITTNDFGYFNLRIGAGTAQSGSFGAITWKTGDVGYEVWVDMGSGSTQLGGRTGFLSVPYALYAANATPAATLSINSPNTVTNSNTGTYSINIAQPSLTVNNFSLGISNGNTIELPGNYSAGSGIAINGTVISNSAPNQSVNLTGTAVNGAYPSYTINQSPSTTLTPGNNNVTITGAAPAYTITPVTPTLVAINNASLSGAWPNQTLSVPAQSLSMNGSTITLSNGGGTVNLPQAAITSVVSGSNVTVSNSGQSFTVNAVTPTLTPNGNITVGGTYPNQTLNVTSQSLSISGSTISLSNGGGTVNVPQTAGASISSGNNVTVSNSGQNFTVAAVTPTLSGTGNIAVGGTYPNQTLNVTPQSLSISGSTISLSNGGGTVNVPQTPAASITSGNNVTVSSSGQNFTVAAVTPTLAGTGNIAVGGTYPNQTLNVPSQTLSISGKTVSLSNGGGNVAIPLTNLSAGNNVTLSGTAPDYTVGTTSQSLSISGSTVSLSGGGGNVTLPSDQVVNISAGSNLSINTNSTAALKNFTLNVITPTLTSSGNISVGGSYPNQTLSVPPQVLSLNGTSVALSNGGGTVDVGTLGWGLLGNNIGTSPVTNYIGTNNGAPLVFKTMAQPRMIITSSGSVGIGVGAGNPTANFDVNSGSIKLGAGSDDFTYFRHGRFSSMQTFGLAGTYTFAVNISGAALGDTFLMTLRDQTGTPGSIQLITADVTGPNTITCVITSSYLLGTTATLSFSYILYRP